MNNLLESILSDDLIQAEQQFKVELNQKIYEKLKSKKARVYIEPKKEVDYKHPDDDSDN